MLSFDKNNPFINIFFTCKSCVLNEHACTSLQFFAPLIVAWVVRPLYIALLVSLQGGNLVNVFYPVHLQRDNAIDVVRVRRLDAFLLL